MTTEKTAAPAATTAPAPAPATGTSETILGAANPADGAGAPPAVAPSNPPAGEAPPAAKPPEPVKYDLKLPKDSRLKPDSIEKIAAIARERGFSPEQAQALVELQSKQADDEMLGQKALLDETRKRWIEEAKADKEIGGDGFGKSAELAKRVLVRFGSDALKEALDETGLGNHPELLRVFKRIGAAMSEDQLVVPNRSAGGPSRRSDAEVLYGTK